ncbi:MAG: GNAT family N-acetyltransferase [Alphaproteobacteria bacterium]|nr:GNAT family N-acetyltransferase [Alphaproteobacteria bacterium]
MQPLQIQLENSIHAIAEDQWDRLAGCSSYDTSSAGNPFVSHRFLAALEDSGAVGGESGWHPRPMTIRSAEGGEVLAATPLYIKLHSMGEFVFDHGWAEASARLGLNYYPKLQVSVPFSPVPGPRLLIHPSYRGTPEGATLGRIMAEQLITLAQDNGLSSIHVTFADEFTRQCLLAAGFLERISFQFHWQNHGYGSFDDFLATLSSRKRKNLRHERSHQSESGIEFQTLSGSAIQPHHWDGFTRAYRAISERKWGSPYLPRQFFDRITETMGEQIVLILASAGAEIIGGALNFRNSERLFGRNWGALDSYKFVHFETCYYRAMDYAIAAGLNTVEAGVQGEHKLQRGYLPVKTVSLHWLGDERLRAAVADFLYRESRIIEEQRAEFNAHSPYRQATET